MLIHSYIDWALIYHEFLANFVRDFDEFKKINNHEKVVLNKFDDIKLKKFNIHIRLNIDCSLIYHNSIKFFKRIDDDLRNVNLNSIVNWYWIDESSRNEFVSKLKTFWNKIK